MRLKWCVTFLQDLLALIGGFHFRGRVSEEQKEEEEAAQRDRQSVLLLP